MQRHLRKRPIQEIRKEELIVATLKSIRKHGFLNSTINTISEESGLSRGLISHYFENKDDLLILSHQYYLQNIDDYFRHVVLSTKTGHFGKLLYSMWVPFLRETTYERIGIHYFSAAWILPDVLKVHRDLWGRYRANIQRRIAAASRERGIVLDARLAAIALTQLADGLWLGWVMEESYTQEDCRRILRTWLCEQFREDPEKYPLTPEFDLEHFETTAPLPKLD
jgi:TetR/AcrR family transcriptional repressor of bet genes